MKKTLLALLISTLFAGAIEEGFTALYNGKDLSGWRKVGGTGEFKAEGECIVGVGENVKGNTFLCTEKSYKDFDLRFDVKFDDLRGNSGFMFRALQKDGTADGRVIGYQCEHDNNKARAFTAGLYDEARRGWLYPGDVKKKDNSPEVKKAISDFTDEGKKLFKWNDWNSVRIVCQGNHIQIWLNDKLRTDYTDTGKDFTAEGFLATQVHAGKACNIRWKNLRIKTL